MQAAALQQNPTTILNNFIQQINQAKDSILCGPDCQKIRREETLKHAYDAARTNMESAPSTVDKTFRAYYINKYGAPAYDEHQTQTLRAAAEKMVATHKATVSQTTDAIERDLTTLQSLQTYADNIDPAYKQYRRENGVLTHNLREKHADTITNDRKTVYESDGVETVQHIRTIMTVAYSILAVLCLTMIWGGGSTFASKFVVSLIIIVYPFVVVQFVSILKGSYYWIAGFMPTNMYLQI